MTAGGDAVVVWSDELLKYDLGDHPLDPIRLELTIALADQAFRSRRPERIADQLAYLLHRYGVPQYMDWWERVALLLGGAMAHYLPSVVVPPIVARLRQETQSVILPGEEEELTRYLAERRHDGMRLNLNQLGEAILGEGEAAGAWTPIWPCSPGTTSSTSR